MSVLLRKQYSTIKKEKLSEQAKSVLKSMYDTTDGFKDAKATRKIKPKFEAFYNKLKESKPEAIVGGKAKSKAAPKKSADDFKAARARRKPQTGVPKDKKAVDKDATRPAISKRGRRVSKAGNTYYEYRDNRFDKNPSKYPMLKEGGIMAKGGKTNKKSFKLGDYVSYAKKGRFFVGTKYYGKEGVIINVIDKNDYRAKGYGSEVYDVLLNNKTNMTASSNELIIDEQPKLKFVNTTIKDGVIIKGNWERSEESKMDKGGMMAKGGKVLMEIDTHKAIKDGDKIKIYRKELEFDSNYDIIGEKMQLLYSIPSENEDDLLPIFYDFEETNRVLMAEANSEFGMAKGGMMAKGGKVGKMYYHILEYGDYGNIGYQGYYETLEDAKNEINRLSGYFPDMSFQIFTSDSKQEPPITTMAEGGYMAKGGMMAKGARSGMKIKDWYIKNYPTDDLGEEINDTITFKGYWGLTSQGSNPYKVLGVPDSVVRERVEEKLSEMLDNSKMAKGGMSQGYDDREDERLGMKDGKMSMKDLDSTHARRDDARFEERGKMAKGGFVSKGELVWRKLSDSKKMEFLYENFTPQITPRSQEILVGKDYQFLPKDVKIKLEAKYANVEEYAEGGKIAVRNEGVDEISEMGEKRYGVEIQDEESGDVLDYQYFDSENEADDFISKYAKGGETGELMGASQNGEPKPSGYFLVKKLKTTAIVRDEDGNLEKYGKSPNFAGYHLIIDGEDYEFLTNYNEKGGMMANGGELASGFSIDEMKEYLEQKFPYSFGFKVYPIKKNTTCQPDYDAEILKGRSLKGLSSADLGYKKLTFPKYKRDHEINFDVQQGGENTYFNFLLSTEDGNEYYSGTFGFKDQGDVDSDYVTGFIAFLMQSYGLPFKVNHSVYAKGGMMADGGGFNQYGEPYGFEEETDSVYEIHHKPEMNPNNPYLIWDKIDGVYIAEFPNRERALHFIDYKKYGYAKGGYMAKGGETHRLDGIFEDGGEIAEGNLEMAMSNVKAISHHAMELKSLLNENTSIEAWVVAKLERAETDLSDVTHYIDGLQSDMDNMVIIEEEFAKGGYMENGGETMKEAYIQQVVEIATKANQNGIKASDLTFEEFSNKVFEATNTSYGKYYLRGAYEVMKNKGYARGGELTPYVIWVSKDGEKREMFGEYKSKRAADMKMNKLWETGEYKTMGNKPKSMYEKEGFYADGGMMADGGKINYLKKWKVKGINMQGRMFQKEIILGRMSDKNDVMYALKRMPDTNIREVTLIEEIKEDGGMMAKGGETEIFEKFMKSQIEYIISLKSISEKKKDINLLLSNMNDYVGDEMQKRITTDNLKYALNQKTASAINNVLKTSLNALKSGEQMAKGGRLSRKQKQLDLNKNGKLDSQDFKMLRAGRKNARKK